MDLPIYNTRDRTIDVLSYSHLESSCRSLGIWEDVICANRGSITEEPSAALIKILPRGFLEKGWRIEGRRNTRVFSTISPDGIQGGSLKITLGEIKEEIKQTKKFHEMGIGPVLKKSSSFRRGGRYLRGRLSAIHTSEIFCTVYWYLKIVPFTSIHILVEKIFDLISIMKNGLYTNTKFRIDNIGICTGGTFPSLKLLDVSETFSNTSVEEDILVLLMDIDDQFNIYNETPRRSRYVKRYKRIAKSFKMFQELVRKKAADVYNFHFPQELLYRPSEFIDFYSLERYCSAVTIQKTFRGFQGKKLSDIQRCIPDNLFGDFYSIRSKKLRIDFTNFN